MPSRAGSVTMATHAGFCFGVRRATDELEQLVAGRAEGERICTLGELIHNDIYNARMAARGVVTVCEEELEALIASARQDSPVVLLVRAHGIPRETRAILERGHEQNPYFRYEDCTCPFVARIHDIVLSHQAPERQLWVFGTQNHPEVAGILSCFEGERHVFSSLQELKDAMDAQGISSFCKNQPIVVAQTTFFLAEWLKCQEFIKKVCTNALIFDTICNVTELRQTEAKALASKCDLMIVVGGKQSSNTSKLAKTCHSQGARTLLVEDAKELVRQLSEPYKNVGIVAGASTPSDIIEEVYKTMSEMENFETLLQDSFKTLNTGDVVTGVVEHVSDTELQLDLGAGVTGYIKAEQITDDPSAKLTALYKKGDEIEAFVIRVSDIEGVAELSKKRVDSDKNWQNIVAAAETREVLEGKVVEAVKGGVLVLSNANRIFVPGSQTGVPKDGDLTALVGTEVKFRVLEIKPGKKAVGSIRSVLRDERAAQQAEFWATMEEGKVFTGVVKSMTTYGAFVDLGGVDGMVHATELSWKHIKSPAEVVAIGDVITVFVKSFDAEKKRISLGYKTEATNPWNIFTSQYAIGDVATVKIVNLMPFGAFAEIVDGVDGLIHISQIAQTRIAKPADVLEVGQTVDARILDIDYDKQKVSLSIRALLDEAQAEAEAMPEEVVEQAAEEAVVEE
ncbi:MAG: 4-hydroxy-3-methylbut-2-enyl diphosphate reductase [Ruminococcaceae bacterium]|nr:4-hydroxy-3-methylbut-2-enyl diphosphate reductase [Oscillospiraceae bacterium]